jgi:hypothetical protein
MWFDRIAALERMGAAAPPPPLLHSIQSLHPAHNVAVVAAVADPAPFPPETIPSGEPASRCRFTGETIRKPNGAEVTAAQYPYGFTVSGLPLTWTGGQVTYAAWDVLSDWDRHGPRGRLWSGIARGWEAPS